ncbi:KAP family P-loop NTPase fold protein [Pseudoteredinibacter isoporae]|uniref:KAP family P-loop NTPase fold protein n=1 Tax=Pseudoteredinibacter isoporae TaxID=570281 RepID=UPI00310581AA
MKHQEMDLLDRHVVAEKIANALTTKLDIFPLLIDGHWGSGKSFFAQLLKEELENKHSTKVLSIYIDCFEHDHLNTARLTILSKTIELLSHGKPEYKKKILNKISNVAKTLVQVSASAALKTVLKINAEEFGKHLEEDLEEEGDKYIKDILSQQERVEEESASLKKILSELAQAEAKKIIIILDELDRCRPDYALSVLESIKHIFDIPEMEFVLIGSLEQLKAIIKKNYGDINSDIYLEKFIKHSTSLPTHSGEEHSTFRYIAKIIERETNEIARDLETTPLNEEKIQILADLISLHGISLRTAERLVKNINVLISMNRKNYFKTNINTEIILCTLFIFTINKNMAKPETKDSIASSVINEIGKCIHHRENKRPKHLDQLNKAYDLLNTCVSTPGGLKSALAAIEDKTVKYSLDQEKIKLYRDFFEEELAIDPTNLVLETFNTMSLFNQK